MMWSAASRNSGTETVPDPFFDAADDVVLVDLPPDDLRQRLKEGKVYIAGQAERAIEHFFRKGNLIALRELALRVLPIALMSKCAPGGASWRRESLAHARRDPFMHRP